MKLIPNPARADKSAAKLGNKVAPFRNAHPDEASQNWYAT
jgi:hypothetical protein